MVEFNARIFYETHLFYSFIFRNAHFLPCERCLGGHDIFVMTDFMKCNLVNIVLIGAMVGILGGGCDG